MSMCDSCLFLVVVVGVCVWWKSYSPISQRWIAIQCLLLLMILHMRCERSGRIVATIANGALKWFLIVVRLHVDLQMIAASDFEWKQFREK